jgi:hypothetical protein
MAANSVIILPSQSHNADSTNGLLIGEKFKGAGFYGMGDGFHSVQIQVTNFTGTITIQGSLATDPSELDWVDITLNDQGEYRVDTTGFVSIVGIINSLELTNSNHNKIYNFVGNFVWVRAKISSWADGHINRIMLNF